MLLGRNIFSSNFADVILSFLSPTLPFYGWNGGGGGGGRGGKEREI